MWCLPRMKGKLNISGMIIFWPVLRFSIIFITIRIFLIFSKIASLVPKAKLSHENSQQSRKQTRDSITSEEQAMCIAIAQALQRKKIDPHTFRFCKCTYPHTYVGERERECRYRQCSKLETAPMQGRVGICSACSFKRSYTRRNFRNGFW